MLVRLFYGMEKSASRLVDFIIEKMKDKNCDYKEMFGYPAYFFNAM